VPLLGGGSGSVGPYYMLGMSGIPGMSGIDFSLGALTGVPVGLARSMEGLSVFLTSSMGALTGFPVGFIAS
jgi:hypothetical protein